MSLPLSRIFKPLLMASTLAMSLALSLTFSTAAVAADTQQPTLKVLTVPAFIPFEMRDPDTGKMTGFDMDILREVAHRAGFNVNIKTMNFSGIIPALQTHSADMAMSGVTITAARAKVVDFSNPYYQSGLQILVRTSNHDVQVMDDLKGKKISTKIGSTSYKYLHDHFGDSATIKPYPDAAGMYLALMGGATDALVYDAPNVSYFARTKGGDRVKVVGPLYEAQPYGIAFAKGSKWVQPVNKALAAMKKDGSYAKIYKKWFGKLPTNS